MKAILFIAAVALGTAESALTRRLTSPKGLSPKRNQARNVAARDDQGDVPAYNFTMPVDHFSPSNKHTYPNRYFVNDTYYQPGAPVIFFDNGEAGFDPGTVATMLAETSGPSLPMRLAANLSALVIGWEHRYYGYSRPVPLSDESGLPLDGADGYRYLSVEQAIEDVAFFANRFNQTKLDQNRIVQTTAGLDPYSTPWIFVGGSYPGARAAWLRLKHPEIIYASWASSAPLQYQFDGSLYYNPVQRSMPRNCTNDIKAAIKYVDDVFGSGSPDAIAQVQTGAYLGENNNASVTASDSALNMSGFDTTAMLASGITIDDGYQGYGPAHTTQIMCDIMEAFDVETYAKDISGITDVHKHNELLMANPGGQAPSKDGIAASNGDNGGQYAFAALVYGMVKARARYNNFTDSLPATGSGPFTEKIDNMSWSWQTLSETGIYQGSNPDNITVISKLYNITSVREIGYELETFQAFSESDFPKTLNNSGILAMGGWDMSASNVMFANGEFDPWRAFSVASQEEKAPKRNVVQAVPKCNEVSSQQDIFGIVYLGAVHVEDLAESPYSTATLVGGKTPQQQGLELFLRAWSVWSPCFNQSRDSIRNGKGVDGNGHDASGNLSSSSGTNSSQSSGVNSKSSLYMIVVASLLVILVI